MGWIYDIEYTNNGKPITVKVGIKNPKEVPGAYVHWIDTKGKPHGEYVQIYTRGVLKDKPKSTVHGCLDKNREPILKIGKEAAKELVTKYNSAFRKYKRNPDNYADLKGKTGEALSNAIKKKANDYAIQQVDKGLEANSRKSDLTKFLNKKHQYEAKIDQGVKYLKENPDKLKNSDLTMEDIEKQAKRMKNRFVRKAVKDINNEINRQAYRLSSNPKAGIYLDANGHMRMGITDDSLSTSDKRKISSRRKAGSFTVKDFIKENKKPSRILSAREVNKKNLADMAAEIKAEKRQKKKAAKKLKDFQKSLNTKNRRRAIEREEKYTRETDLADEEMKANMMYL